MDVYEATKIVMSRIQSLDPENASKIMGYTLIQDQGENEMIRLAFSPEALLLSYINQAKAVLGLPSNDSSSLPYSIRSNNFFPQNSPRVAVPNNGFPSNPSSPAAPSQRSSPRPISYAAALDGSIANSSATNSFGSPSLHFYGGKDFGDDFFSGGVHNQAQGQLPFYDDPVVDPTISPSGRSDSLVFPYGEDANSIPSLHPHSFHRRSSSVNDAAFLSNLEEGIGDNGFPWRPCMYFARGFCKNGTACKFLHSDIGGVEAIDAGSPSKTCSGFDEMLRMKALQHQRFSLMASGVHHPLVHNKCMDPLNENLRMDLSPMGLGAGASSSSRQIYLTFPSDSTFKEEDVSNYFSMFGPVQDVRIPYQQKRMFGFVTFVNPETVKLILAKGNPHFLCDSRVLVKPYKEKGKVREKKHRLQHQQHLDRGEYSDCLSPSRVDSSENFDVPFAGSRMSLSTHEMMLHRKLEQQAELQHAIELQGRRMMNLQLVDMKNQNHNPHFLRNFPTSIAYSSQRRSHLLIDEPVSSSNSISQEDSEVFAISDIDGEQGAAASPTVATDEKLVVEGTELSTGSTVNGHNPLHFANADGSDLPESLEHVLPDNLFASPKKLAAEGQSVYFPASDKVNASIPVITSSKSTPVVTGSSPLTSASLKSCYLQMPRFSSGQETVKM